MKYKDLIRTFGTGLLAAALCLTMTTACTEENPAGDDTENNGGGGSAGGGTEDNGGGGSTGSNYNTDYTDEDLTYDEATGVYTIRTERGLNVWARGIWENGCPEASAVLAADIVLGNDMPDYCTETLTWEAVDLLGNITFDGAGHTISGMRIENDHSSHGFFCTVEDGAKVINLTVEGSMRYTGDDESYRGGGIAGECDGGRIVNCTFRGTIDGGAVDGGSSRTALTMVGGIVGYAHNGSTIRNCTAEGTFTAGGSFSQVGGIVGQNSMQTLGQTVRDCHTTENCHVTGYWAEVSRVIFMAQAPNCAIVRRERKLPACLKPEASSAVSNGGDSLTAIRQKHAASMHPDMLEVWREGLEMVICSAVIPLPRLRARSRKVA